MIVINFIAAFAAFLVISFSTAQTITPQNSPPPKYQTGFSTQDTESAGQQSICNTNCQGSPGSLSGATTSGPSGGLPDGVYAAAINPAMGGGASDCSPCGHCYSIVNSGMPLCSWNATSCPVQGRTGPMVQTGPSTIKILITNHCTDCNLVDGWFDINDAPSGWNNPKIYWQQLPDEECQGSSATS